MPIWVFKPYVGLFYSLCTTIELSLQSQIQGRVAKFPFPVWPREKENHRRDHSQGSKSTQQWNAALDIRCKCTPRISPEVQGSTKDMGWRGLTYDPRLKHKASGKYVPLLATSFTLKKKKFLNATNILIDCRKLHLKWLIEDKLHGEIWILILSFPLSDEWP